MNFFEILIGALVVEAIMSIVLVWIPIGPAMTSWYRELGLGAIAMDVVSMSVGTWIGVRLAALVAGSNIVAQLLGAILVQVTHDAIFGMLLLPRLPPSRPVNLFRAYAEEKQGRILLDDAILMACTVLCARGIQFVRSRDVHAVVGAISLYVPLLLLL